MPGPPQVTTYLAGRWVRRVPRCAGVRPWREGWRRRRRGGAALTLKEFQKGGDWMWPWALWVRLSSDWIPVMACWVVRLVVYSDLFGERVGRARGALVNGGAHRALRLRALWSARPRGWARVGGLTYYCATIAVVAALPAAVCGRESGGGWFRLMRASRLCILLPLPQVGWPRQCPACAY